MSQKPPEVPPVDRDLPIDCDINQVKNCKTEGRDKIPAEALKADLETIVDILYHQFENVLGREQVPSGCSKGYIIKFPKKGDQFRDSSWTHQITTLCITEKSV